MFFKKPPGLRTMTGGEGVCCLGFYFWGKTEQLFVLSPVSIILIKKSHADTSLVMGHMPGCLPQHSRCSLMHFLQDSALPTGPWSGRSNYLLCSQCHQKTLSPENVPAMAKRVVQQLVQLPPLSTFSGCWWVTFVPSTLMSICTFLLIKPLRR